MKAAVMMMQKDEFRLLEPWIIHHSDLFGIENLYIYDNGSTDDRCISVLEKYSKKGANIYFHKITFEDFNTRNIDFMEHYNQLREEKGYGLFFPLDCDEFIAVEYERGVTSIKKEAILEELRKYNSISSTLKIKCTYGNHPLDPKEFAYSPKPDKVFFVNSKITSLSNGFHRGDVESKDIHDTNIIYFHYHHKNYQDYIQSSRNKLEGLVDVDDLDAVKEFKGAGHHLVKKFLMTESEYYEMHADSKKRVPSKFFMMPEVFSYLDSIGLNLSKLDNAHSVNEEPAVAWHGYVDHVKTTEESTAMVGWCVAKPYCADTHFYLSLKGEIIPGYLETRIDRTDVVNKFEGYPLDCGFVVIFNGVRGEHLMNDEWQVIVSGGARLTSNRLARKEFIRYFN